MSRTAFRSAQPKRLAFKRFGSFGKFLNLEELIFSDMGKILASLA